MLGVAEGNLIEKKLEDSRRKIISTLNTILHNLEKDLKNIQKQKEEDYNQESIELSRICISEIYRIKEQGLNNLNDLDNLSEFSRRFDRCLNKIQEDTLIDLRELWLLIQELASVLGLVDRQ